jgi:hypothetical protein
MFDFLGELVSSMFGGLLGEAAMERRAGRTKKRIAAFEQGLEIRIPCAVREDGQRKWRHGSLRLAPGRAAWAGRFDKEPSLVLSRHTSTADYSRHVGLRESVWLNGGMRVLGYRVGDDLVELAVLPRTLVLVGRVLDLPPNP